MTYQFTDWQDGARPPKGFDVADAIAFGWSKDDLQAMMRASVSDKMPAFPVEPEPVARVDAPQAVQAWPCGADGIDQMSRVVDIDNGGEVGIAQHFAAAMKERCGHVVRADGAFWAFGPTAWQEVPAQKLRLAVHGYSGTTVQGKTPIKLSSRAIDGVLTEAGTILGNPMFFADPTVGLNARNCVVRIGHDGQITAHDHNPDDRFRFTIAADFDVADNMAPPAGSLLHRLLDGAFRDDPDAAAKIDLIGEILGAAAFGMATRLPQPKAFVFLGESASNGKSTIASLIECLLPEGAVSHIPPSAFEDERRIVHLAGKAANVADELSASAVAGNTFKAAVTGDTIEGRDLYKSALSFTPRALHLFTTNVLPRFNGGLDRGLQRRLVVVTFNRPIPASEIIADIAERIRRDELNLLLQFAVAGAQRLTLRHAYTEPASSKEALQDWLRLDPIVEWFERVEQVEHEPVGGWLRTSDLYHDFKAWALAEGHSEKFLPIVSTFGQRLKSMPGVEMRHRAKGTVVIGIDLPKKGRPAGDLSDW